MIRKKNTWTNFKNPIISTEIILKQNVLSYYINYSFINSTKKRGYYFGIFLCI